MIYRYLAFFIACLFGNAYASSIGWLTPITDQINKAHVFKLSAPDCINTPIKVNYKEDFTISWCEVSHSTHYKLIGLSQEPIIIAAPETSYSVGGLTHGEYVLKIQSCKSQNCSESSLSHALQVLSPIAPAKITNISLPEQFWEKGRYFFDLQLSTDNLLLTHFQVEAHLNGEVSVTNYEVDDQFTLNSSATSNSYRIRGCIDEVCGEYSDLISYQVQSALEQGLEITNVVQWEGGYANIDGVFDLQWQQQTNVDSYDIIYGFSDLDTGELVEKSINNLPGNAFTHRVVLPKEVRNGLVSFYLIPYRENNAINSLKVNGLIKLQLARPSISHFSNITGKCDTTGNCDHFFKVKFKNISQASRYQIFVSYSAVKNGNEQRYRSILYYDADQSSPNYPLPTEEGGEFVIEFNLNLLADKNGATPITGAVHVKGQALRPESYPSAVQLQIMSNLTATKTLAWRKGSNQLAVNVISPIPSTVFLLDDNITANVFACDKGVSGSCNSNDNGIGIDFVEYTLQGPGVDFSYKVTDAGLDYFQSFNDLFVLSSTAKTGRYNLFINVVNTSGHNITKLITFTREAGSYSNPVINNITETANNNEYLIDWDGYQHADVKRLYRQINPN